MTLADETRQDTAPKIVEIKAPKKTTRAPRDTAPKTRKKNLTKPLTGFISTVGTMVSIANTADGLAILNGAERLAEALNNVAKENDRVYKALMTMIEVSVWGELTGATLAIILPIMANHDLLPVEIPGMTAPKAKETADGF